MTEPPPGIKCADCGCCLATVKAADDWICWECDAGEPCKGKRIQQPAQPVEPISPAAPAEREEISMSSNKQGQKISEETRSAILGESASISHADLARKYGISDVSVRKIRIDGGVHAPRHSTAAKPAIAAPKTQPTPIAPRPAAKPSGTVTVAIDIDAQRADAFWTKLSAEEKSVAIRAVLMARLETI